MIESTDLLDSFTLVCTSGAVITPARFFQLRNSAHCGELKVLKDALGRPLGYIALAFISKYTARRVLQGANLEYPYEWNEGGICMIVDVALVGPSAPEGLRMLKDRIRDERAIIFSRKGRHRLYIQWKGKMRKFAAKTEQAIP
jgi:hypothetical protein